ncbi:MAG: cupin domain-containing protein [Opitutaceae bacterium]|nr:cupin domain-containing protein [Opitutaceae bacterium]
MIIRHPQEGQKLDVAGLNEITVLIDRSETALTEVAINAWTPGLDGPPHVHERKEQNFLVLDGHGEVHIGGRTFQAAAGDFFYVPAGMVHQTISRDPVMGLGIFSSTPFSTPTRKATRRLPSTSTRCAKRAARRLRSRALAILWRPPR